MKSKRKYTIDDVTKLARRLGGGTIVTDGEDEFSVTMEDDTVPFSFDQDGIDDAIDLLKEIKEERKLEKRP